MSRWCETAAEGGAKPIPTIRRSTGKPIERPPLVTASSSGKPSRRDRASKLDTFKPALAELLAPAPVLLQRLQTLGYDGGITILKDYLLAVLKNAVLRRAYVRMEPSAGERFDIDWGHFGVLLYDGTPRKLYALCLVECHSRKMYLEFGGPGSL